MWLFWGWNIRRFQAPINTLPAFQWYYEDIEWQMIYGALISWTHSLNVDRSRGFRAEHTDREYLRSLIRFRMILDALHAIYRTWRNRSKTYLLTWFHHVPHTPWQGAKPERRTARDKKRAMYRFALYVRQTARGVSLLDAIVVQSMREMFW